MLAYFSGVLTPTEQLELPLHAHNTLYLPLLLIKLHYNYLFLDMSFPLELNS